MSIPIPKTTTDLYGHEEAEKLLQREFASDKLAHGWIISGPQGIGKATLAYRFARSILSGKSPDDITPEDPIFLRIAAGSHTDFLALEPIFDTKKDEFARDITVDQARELPEFMSKTPGEGQWRVVIIDAVDNLNTNGANAILKILEEPPPQAIIMLISHNPGRLLPTIRSRCHQLTLKALTPEQYRQVMRHTMPDIAAGEAATLGALTAYSPGIAIGLHELGAITLYNKMVDVFTTLPSLDLTKAHSFSDAITGSQQHANWKLFTRLALILLQRIVFQTSGVPLESISDKETALLTKMADLHPVQVWATKWQEVAYQFLLAERLHLDYKQFVLIFLHSITSKEEFRIGNAAA